MSKSKKRKKRPTIIDLVDEEDLPNISPLQTISEINDDYHLACRLQQEYDTEVNHNVNFHFINNIINNPVFNTMTESLEQSNDNSEAVSIPVPRGKGRNRRGRGRGRGRDRNNRIELNRLYPFSNNVVFNPDIEHDSDSAGEYFPRDFGILLSHVPIFNQLLNMNAIENDEEGLIAAQISSLPTSIYNDSCSSKKKHKLQTSVNKSDDDVNTETCCICMDNMINGDIVRRLPCLIHTFHIECIDDWLKRSNLCPICRIKCNQ